MNIGKLYSTNIRLCYHIALLLDHIMLTLCFRSFTFVSKINLTKITRLAFMGSELESCF